MANDENFYLQSPTTVVGTTRPTHYVALHKSDQTPTEIQEMTFKLCYYLYGRSVTRSVSHRQRTMRAKSAITRDVTTDVPLPFAPGSFNPTQFLLQPHECLRSHILHLTRLEMIDVGRWVVWSLGV